MYRQGYLLQYDTIDNYSYNTTQSASYSIKPKCTKSTYSIITKSINSY